VNRQEIIQMARAAGFRFSDEEDPLLANHAEWQIQLFERFAALVAAAEREACAVLCSQQKDQWVDGSDQWGNPCPAKVRATPSSCAAAIRARNNI